MNQTFKDTSPQADCRGARADMPTDRSILRQQGNVRARRQGSTANLTMLRTVGMIRAVRHRPSRQGQVLLKAWEQMIVMGRVSQLQALNALCRA
jgi:hypothetical protein